MPRLVEPAFADEGTAASTALSRFNAVKRVGDVIAVLLTLPLSGFAMIVIGLVIRVLDGPEPVFRQEREGLRGTSFHALKFRTMSQARDGSGELLPDRQRLTTVGRLLRRSSLDELPQLLNVLKGDMSLVGPRPLYTRYSSCYTDRERQRQLVRPGITGLAQTSGRNGVGWTQRLELDVRYVEHHSFHLDLVILARTVRKAVMGEGIDIIAGDSGDPLDVERSYPRVESMALRRLYRGDLERRVLWLSDDRTRRYMTVQGEVTVSSTAEWYDRVRVDDRRKDFVAYDRRTGQVLAMAGLTGLEGGSTEYYIFVDPDCTGRGIGGVTTDLVIRWASRSHFADRLWLAVAADNTRALKVYERCGFQATSHEGSERLVMTHDIGRLR